MVNLLKNGRLSH